MGMETAETEVSILPANCSQDPNTLPELDTPPVSSKNMVRYTSTINTCRSVRKVRRKHKMTKSSTFGRSDANEYLEEPHTTSPRSCVELYYNSQESSEDEERNKDSSRKLALSLPTTEMRVTAALDPDMELVSLDRQKLGRLSASLDITNDITLETIQCLKRVDSQDHVRPGLPQTAWEEDSSEKDQAQKKGFLPQLDSLARHSPSSELTSQLSNSKLSTMCIVDGVPEVTKKPEPPGLSLSLDRHVEHPSLPLLGMLQDSKQAKTAARKEPPNPQLYPQVSQGHSQGQTQSQGHEDALGVLKILGGPNKSQSNTNKPKALPPIEANLKKESKGKEFDKRKSGKSENNEKRKSRKSGSKSSSREKSSQSVRSVSSNEPMPTVYQKFTRPPRGQPLTLCFDYPNTYLTHRYVFDQIKFSIQNVPFGNVNALQFRDRNVVHETSGLENRWLITLSCPEARDYLLRSGIKLFNNKIYMRRLDDVLKQEYRYFAKQEKEMKRLRGETEDEDPDDPFASDKKKGESGDQDDTTSSSSDEE